MYSFIFYISCKKKGKMFEEVGRVKNFNQIYRSLKFEFIVKYYYQIHIRKSYPADDYVYVLSKYKHYFACFYEKHVNSLLVNHNNDI